MPIQMSDPLHFEYEGRKYRAQLHISSKIWMFHDLTKNEFLGSKYDIVPQDISVERAIEILKLYFKEVNKE
jgi:hypothetical protein